MRENSRRGTPRQARTDGRAGRAARPQPGPELGRARQRSWQRPVLPMTAGPARQSWQRSWCGLVRGGRNVRG